MKGDNVTLFRYSLKNLDPLHLNITHNFKFDDSYFNDKLSK
jgi:hypothetical protein